MSSLLRSSKFVRYFLGLARGIVNPNRRQIEGGLLQQNHNLTGLFSNNFSSNPLRIQSGSLLEQTIRQLDEDARRSGRVSLTDVQEALNSIKNTKKVSASQSLMVIRCCGNLVPEKSPEHRTKLVDEIWKTFEKLGVPLDISHYNALLKVYLENEHKFSPTEFLARLEESGIEPNRVTYQRLIAGFCQQGDIVGATKILEFMKEKQLPVSEGVFNALILGHSKADDMESAEAILNVMRQANLEPSNETYTTLLSGYAARGDSESVQRVLTECKVKDVLLSDRDFLEIGYAAVVNGHNQLLDEILKNIRHSIGYNQDAANLIIRLVTAGKDEAAYKVFLTLNPNLRTDDAYPNMSGHIFIKQLVKCNRPVSEILPWLERLRRDGHTSLGLWLAVEASFYHGDPQLTLDLLRALRESGEPVRHHYFWPTLVSAGKTNDFSRTLGIIKQIIEEFNMTVNAETLRDYIMPYVPGSKSSMEVLQSLEGVGVRKGQAVVALVSHLVAKQKVKEAAELAYQHQGFNYRNNLTTPLLVDVLQSSGDVSSVVGLLQVLANYGGAANKDDKDEQGEQVSGDELITRFLVNLISFTPSRKYLRDVLKEMVEHGIPISSACGEIIGNKLQGGELTSEISELLGKLSSGEVVPKPRPVGAATTFVKTPESLMKIKERMKANNESEDRLISINRSLYQLYCFEGDVDNALKIKQELEEEYKQEATPGMWANLLGAYCANGNLEGVIKCLETMKSFGSSSEFELDVTKILRVAKLYTENNRIEDAESLLKTVKAREKENGQISTRNQAWQFLQAVVETYKDPELVKNMINLLVSLKYIEINNAVLGSVVKTHLLRGDLEGALKEFEECVKLHRATPYKNDLTMRFIEKEDAKNLQTVVDLSTEVHGEVNSLYDLVLAFVECGKIKQARKILETPGLTSRNNRLLLACERFKKDGKSACLEGLLEATKDMGFMDRAEIFNNLLDTYCQADEAEKALGLWTKMQDEDVRPSDEFLIKLGTFLKKKGHQVPFEIPSKGATTTTGTTEVQKKTTDTVSQVRSPLLNAISMKKVDEALKIKDELERSGKPLTKTEVNRFLELLVEQSRFRDAVAVLPSLMKDEVPATRVLNFLMTRLAGGGEYELMLRIEPHLSEPQKKATSFTNRLLSAAVAVGRGREELDKLERAIDAATSSDDIDQATAKLPPGGIMAGLKSPADYEQVKRIVDKFHGKGSFLPANCLVMHHLAQGDVEQARQLFQQYGLGNSSQLMFRSVLAQAVRDRNPRLLDELLVMVDGSPAVTPEARGLIYSKMFNIYSDQENYEAALQKLEEAVKTVPLEMFHISSLERLKTGIEASNKPFNYTIPPPRQNYRFHGVGAHFPSTFIWS